MLNGKQHVFHGGGVTHEFLRKNKNADTKKAPQAMPFAERGGLQRFDQLGHGSK
jgi:hypothetical protein